MSQNNIEVAIKAVIDLYFKGTFNNNAAMLNKAFYKDARITGLYNDSYIDLSLSEFIARVEQQEMEGINKIYDKKILSLNHQKNIASVIAKVRVGEEYFTDYITLLKIDGAWCIRNKSFSNQPYASF